MKSTTNKQRLTNLIKGIQKSIDLFESQGHANVYFTAQFMRDGKKQNCIERGDINSFSTQIRTYVNSEEADTVRIEFFDEETSKSIYSKALTDLRTTSAEENPQPATAPSFNGFSGFNGLGEAQFEALVDKRVDVKEQAKDFARQGRELDELRVKYATLEKEKEELDAELKAKKNLEFYSGIIGAAFPGLAPLFNGTPLAQAAGYLAGTGDGQSGATQPANGDVQSTSAMVAEFCNTLSPTDASAMHMLCVVFEKDRSKIQSTLQQVMAGNPAT